MWVLVSEDTYSYRWFSVVSTIPVGANWQAHFSVSPPHTLPLRTIASDLHLTRSYLSHHNCHN